MRSHGVFPTREAAEAAADDLRRRLGAGERQPRRVLPDPLVYFARLGPLVKIGVSVSPEVRAKEFAAVVVRTEEGGYFRETLLHREFAHLRVSGEWFRCEGELADYLSSS